MLGYSNKIFLIKVADNDIVITRENGEEGYENIGDRQTDPVGVEEKRRG